MGSGISVANLSATSPMKGSVMSFDATSFPHKASAQTSFAIDKQAITAGHRRITGQLSGGAQTWNLQNADIRAVIQTVSVVTGRSFIVDPRVKGRITFVSHKPMGAAALYHVFLSMLQVLNYTVVPSGDAYKVVPAVYAKEYGARLANRTHPGQGDEVVVRVVPVNNVSAIQLVPVLRPLMPSWGSVSAYMPSNALVLVGSAQNMYQLIAMVHQMDQTDASHISLISLKYADARRVVAAINALQLQDRSQGKVTNVSVVADSENNSLLVSANLANTLLLKRLIKKMDSQQHGGSGNTLVIHLNYQDAKTLAPILTNLAAGSLSGKAKGKSNVGNGGVSVQAEHTENAIIMHGPKRVLDTLKRVVAELDVRPGQVLVEAIIVKIDENLLNRLGVVWGSVDSAASPTGIASSDGRVHNSFALCVTHGFGLIKNGNIEALVQALKSDSSTEILSTPSVMVMNNQEASIDDGKNIGMLNREYSTNTNSQTQVVPFNTFERKDVTLSLKVTPQISPNHMLRLKIEQHDDSLSADASSTSTNPVIETSKIMTHVLVKSGDILVLGGLVKRNHIHSVTKVPILGSLPIVGLLFRHKTDTVEKKNLMVFLRPLIVGDNLAARHVSRLRYHYIRGEQKGMERGRQVDTSSPVLEAYPDHRAVLPAPKSFAPVSSLHRKKAMRSRSAHASKQRRVPDRDR